MPTYDYECRGCGHRFERFQGIQEPKFRTCPSCRRRRLVRLVGAGSGLIFRGSGFYETDYKRARSPAPASGEGASSPPGSGPSDGAASGPPAPAGGPAEKEGGSGA
jgi:putative FmdB family regulatory protein